MGDLNLLIGDRFEEICEELIPSINKIVGIRGGSTPDYNHIGGDGEIDFLLEMKAGYEGYGPVPKGNQIEGFKKWQYPVLYVFGYHTLEKPLSKVIQKTRVGRRRYLRNNMGIKSIYFISSDVVESLYLGQRSEILEDTGEVGYHCIIREKRLIDLIEGRDFKRDGMVVNPYKYFKLTKEDLIMKSPTTTGDFSCGYIISKEYITLFQPFLEGMDIF